MRYNRDVPVGGIGVHARFDGEVDASTVKHRLDVLYEVRLPVYITDFSISNRMRRMASSFRHGGATLRSIV
jgi:hypothetical protein